MHRIVMVFLSGMLLASSCDTNSEKSPAASVDFDPAPWILKGQDIQKSVFGAMSSQLTSAMATDGVPGALTYCQLQAYPLTDSLSQNFGVAIRRATHQPRNKANKAQADEAAVLSNYSKAIVAGKELNPMAVEDEHGGISYYSPIRIQPLCLNCHGTPGEDLKTTDYDVIKSLYPDDQATGYKLDDLRGIWHIQWTKSGR